MSVDNYLADYRSYPATYAVEGVTDEGALWIGLKVAQATGVVLDARWWGPHGEIGDQLDLFTHWVVGQTVGALAVDFEKYPSIRVVVEQAVALRPLAVE